MRSRELPRRLDRLKLPVEKEPKLVHDFGALSRVENARFWELYHMLRQGEELTKDEAKEFWSLWNRCPLVEPGNAGSPYAESNEERRERRALEWAFAGAFHDFQIVFLPCRAELANGLYEYRLEIGYELFKKYGWIIGARECSTILPLDHWEPEQVGVPVCEAPEIALLLPPRATFAGQDKGCPGERVRKFRRVLRIQHRHFCTA
jgi:hypothetical protein